MERFKKLIDNKISDDPINDVGYYLRMIDDVDRDIAKLNTDLHDRLQPLRRRCLRQLSLICDHKPTQASLRCTVCHRVLEEQGSMYHCSHCNIRLKLDKNRKLWPLLRCNVASIDDRCYLCPVCMQHVHQRKPTSL